jgi:hypothetical protein
MRKTEFPRSRVERIAPALDWAVLALCLWAGGFYFVPRFSELTQTTRVVLECRDAHCGLRFERKPEARS